MLVLGVAIPSRGFTWFEPSIASPLSSRNSMRVAIPSRGFTWFELLEKYGEKAGVVSSSNPLTRIYVV